MKFKIQIGSVNSAETANIIDFDSVKEAEEFAFGIVRTEHGLFGKPETNISVTKISD